MINNPHLFIEYTGSLPGQNWFYDGNCTTFWTLPDGRQVTDCLNERIYRHLLKTMDHVRPFVPKSEDDWDNILSIVDAEAKEKAKAEKKEKISSLESIIKHLADQAKQAMDKAASMIEEANDLREGAIVIAEKSEKFVEELADLKPKRKVKPKPKAKEKK